MASDHAAPTQPVPRPQRPFDPLGQGARGGDTVPYPVARPLASPGGPSSSLPGSAGPDRAPGTGGPTTASVASRAASALVALVSTALVWVTWRFFVDTAAGQHVERLAFEGSAFGKGQLWRVAEPVLDVVSVTFVVVGLGAAMLIALLRRRWGLAVQVAFLVAGSNITTQVLKHELLARENLIGGYTYPNALPSGHTTVAASVSAALLLVVPRSVRPVVAILGGAYTAATGISTLIGQWHRPSDVVAAVLVVLAWGAVVCAFTPPSALDIGAGRARASTVVAILLLATTVAAGLGAAWSLREVYPEPWGAPDGDALTAYLGGALGVVAVTAAAFAVLLLLRQATARPRGSR